MTPTEYSENTRRLLLRVIAKIMVAFAVIVSLWVILSPLFKPNVPVNVKTVETAIDISTYAQDSVKVHEWFDKPLIIARRSAATEEVLQNAALSNLRDPDNKRSVQPAYAHNNLRSPVAGWFVAIGIGTSSGCALVVRPLVESQLKPEVLADSCDGSVYDLAGRALNGSVARKNLPIPHWKLAEDRIIVSTESVRD